MAVLIASHNYFYFLFRFDQNVQVGNDQEKAQLEKKTSTPKTEVGKTKLTTNCSFLFQNIE